MISISPEKRRHLEAISDTRGVIAALAIDQRGSLRSSIAEAGKMPKEEVSDEMMMQFKSSVVRILSPYSSAVLLDPEYGLEAAHQRRKGCGLILAYEQSGYDNTQPGRMPDLLPDVSAEQIKDWGGNAVKLLVYYSPFERESINESKLEFVERVGEECAQANVPLLLEMVGYAVGGDENGPEYAKIKPDIVSLSIAEFSKEKYGVDILKVEIPVNLRFVEGTKAFDGIRAYSKTEALAAFSRSAAEAKKPFIYLSAGVSMDQFEESLGLAAEAKIPFSGVLCGRATWKDGISEFAISGLSAFEKWLDSKGVENIKRVNDCLRAAVSWDRARLQTQR
jgi:tagatose 1,6-diphosphate aldolase